MAAETQRAQRKSGGPELINHSPPPNRRTEPFTLFLCRSSRPGRLHAEALPSALRLTLEEKDTDRKSGTLHAQRPTLHGRSAAVCHAGASERRREAQRAGWVFRRSVILVRDGRKRPETAGNRWKTVGSRWKQSETVGKVVHRLRSSSPSLRAEGRAEGRFHRSGTLCAQRFTPNAAAQPREYSTQIAGPLQFSAVQKCR